MLVRISSHFSRRFVREELRITAIDINEPMLRFAREKCAEMDAVLGDALDLPFKDQSFDYCIGVTSLCFVTEPLLALEEMMRITRKCLVVGLLNRNSLLYWLKHGQGGYTNARWDRKQDIERMALQLGYHASVESAIFLPMGGAISRGSERLIPGRFPIGGFLAARICKER